MFLYYYENKAHYYLKKLSPSCSRWVYLFIYDVVMFIIIYCTWKLCLLKSSLREASSQLGNTKYWSGSALWIINFDILTRARFSTQPILHNDTEIISLQYLTIIYFLLLIWFADSKFKYIRWAPLLGL